VIKFLSLEINPKGITGLSSPRFDFGEQITQFRGDNRSGKTPMVQTLVYCLGYPIQFRRDLISHCSSATLKVKINEAAFTFERTYSESIQDFDLTVTSAEEITRYTSEADFSAFFFSKFGLLPTTLTDIKGKGVIPYISTVLPIFYLDQDTGYSEIYRPSSKFIRDQFLEVVRYIFSFAAKNSFDSAKEVLKLTSERNAIDELIGAYKVSHARLAESVGSVSENVLKSQLEGLNTRLVALQESQGSQSESLNAIQAVRQNFSNQRWALDAEIRELSLRIDSYSRIKMEMEAEGDALSLNAKARRIFESAVSVCANVNCGLFKVSEASYAKNLLYLKDQIKDLDLNIETVKVLRSHKSAQLEQIRQDIDALDNEEKSVGAATPIQGLVVAVNEITRSIVNFERQLVLIDQVKKSTLKLVEFETKRDGLTNRIDSANAKGRTAEADMLWLRSELKDATIRWLGILETEGVDRNVKIDSLLNFEFGSEQLNSFKGSTRVRVVLAVHAALFEIYLGKVNLPFAFLVFDTPNQQELENTDLTKFMNALKSLCIKYGAQIIFSSKDYKLNADEKDKIYLPTYPGEKHLMYLGTKQI
jgi:hypothetical protein